VCGELFIKLREHPAALLPTSYFFLKRQVPVFNGGHHSHEGERLQLLSLFMKMREKNSAGEFLQIK